MQSESLSTHPHKTQEFHPYIFQVFAQLLETREPGTPLPPSYVALFPPLLSATFWERSGNTPALVRLVRAYLAASPAQVVAGGHLPAVLGIFQKLVASRALDHEGFLLLDALYCGGVPLTALAPYTPHVWTLLFQRLQAARTAKFVRGFVVFTAAFAAMHGPGELMQALEAVQAGIGLMILDTVGWVMYWGGEWGGQGRWSVIRKACTSRCTCVGAKGEG